MIPFLNYNNKDDSLSILAEKVNKVIVCTAAWANSVRY